MSFQDPLPPTVPHKHKIQAQVYTDPDSEPEATSSSICTADTESLSGPSTASTCSDRQLRPRLPIHYNETFLMRLQGRPQSHSNANTFHTTTIVKFCGRRYAHHRATVKMSTLYNCRIYL